MVVREEEFLGTFIQTLRLLQYVTRQNSAAMEAIKYTLKGWICISMTNKAWTSSQQSLVRSAVHRLRKCLHRADLFVSFPVQRDLEGSCWAVRASIFFWIQNVKIATKGISSQTVLAEVRMKLAMWHDDTNFSKMEPKKVEWFIFTEEGGHFKVNRNSNNTFSDTITKRKGVID